MSTTTSPLPDLAVDTRKWYRHLNGYHWYVLGMCALGWLFDCADQQIFTASRANALRDLMPGTTAEQQGNISALVTMLFMVGWATGGLVFGTIGDKWGRAKTMALTVFLYAAFTGLSALAHSWQMFTVARFATGFGVGGEFAAGASLVTDVMPAKARGPALTMLQASSALGNILAAFMLGLTSKHFDTHLAWRYLYLIGALPAVLAVGVMSWMREPEKWVKARAEAKATGELKKFGSLTDLFAHPRWRRNALVGLALAVSGVIGLWGIGFYSPELIDSTFPQMSVATGQRLTPLVANLNIAGAPEQIKALDGTDMEALRDLLSRVALRDQTFKGDLSGVRVTASQQQKMTALLAKRMTSGERDGLKSRALMLQQLGAFFGMLTAGILAIRIGRRVTFALSFAAAWAAIVIVFLNFQQPSQIWTLYPFLGFCTLLPFGAYAIYFPEIFPTRLRSTGTGFCYNVGRYIAAFGPPMLMSLRNHLIGHFEIPAFRAAAVIVSSIFAIGIIAAFLGPETKGQPLPED